jgi:hypothetical protein
LSFRGRLALFFVLIVVLPMIALAALVVQIVGDSASGKADARLAADLESAIAICEDRAAEADSAGRQIAADPRLADALRGSDPASVKSAARTLATEQDLRSLVISDEGGDELAAVGDPRAIASASVEIADGKFTGLFGELARSCPGKTVGPQQWRDFVVLTNQITGPRWPLACVWDRVRPLPPARNSLPQLAGQGQARARRPATIMPVAFGPRERLERTYVLARCIAPRLLSLLHDVFEPANPIVMGTTSREPPPGTSRKRLSAVVNGAVKV